ncbi:MAG: DUF1828 domain-containing protein [Dehalococcoidales bacterium]|nr:DUF1828 domain-containing protein [Dehalococcoidales bacterium]
MKGLSEQTISQYVEFVRNLFTVRESEERRLIVTPFTRPDGEYIELQLVEQNGGKVLITDNCNTIDYLFTNGINVETTEFEALLSLIARNFGVTKSDEEIYRIATKEELANDVHRMLNAMIGMSFLIYRRRLPQPTQLRFRRKFPTQVRDTLNKMKIPYEPKSIKGKFITHTIPFCASQEYLIYPLTADTEDSALSQAMLLGFRWIDIREAGNKYRRITVIDDATPKKRTYWENGPLQILSALSDKVARWSEPHVLEKVLQK